MHPHTTGESSAFQLLFHSSGIFVASQKIVKLSLLEKALLYIVVTLLGINIFVNLVQCEKAHSPILEIWLGTIKLVKLEQPENVLAPMLVILFESTTYDRFVHPLKADVCKHSTLFGKTILSSLVQS